jgi:hypothetical protein
VFGLKQDLSVGTQFRLGCTTHWSNQQQKKRCEINGRENQAIVPFDLMLHGLAFLAVAKLSATL